MTSQVFKSLLLVVLFSCKGASNSSSDLSQVESVATVTSPSTTSVVTVTKELNPQFKIKWYPFSIESINIKIKTQCQLMYFRKSNCINCDWIENNIFTNKDIANIVNDMFVATWFPSDWSSFDKDKYELADIGIDKFPSFMLILNGIELKSLVISKKMSLGEYKKPFT